MTTDVLHFPFQWTEQNLNKWVSFLLYSRLWCQLLTAMGHLQWCWAGYLLLLIWSKIPKALTWFWQFVAWLGDLLYSIATTLGSVTEIGNDFFKNVIILHLAAAPFWGYESKQVAFKADLMILTVLILFSSLNKLNRATISWKGIQFSLRHRFTAGSANSYRGGNERAGVVESR